MRRDVRLHNQSEKIGKEIARVDAVLAACQQRGINPLCILEREVKRHDHAIVSTLRPADSERPD